MTARQLLSAFTDIRDAYIEDTRAALGYGGDDRAAHAPRRRGVTRLARAVLIAAIITALLTAAAYAAGWLGLAGLRIGAQANTGLVRISLQGLADTPEARGATEWLDYIAAQNQTPREGDAALAADCAAKYGTYGIANQADLNMLNTLCEKYDLVPLGTSRTPKNEREFCEMASVGRLTARADGYVNEYQSAYVYSSGTFHAEGRIYSDAHAYDIPYQLTRSEKGVLDYVTISVADVNDFTEREYVSAGGAALHLANAAPEAARRQSFIFLETDDAFISVSFLHEAAADYLGDGVIDGVGDEYVTYDIPDAELEMLAECFDWAAFSDPSRGMDTDFAPTREYASVDTAALIAVRDKAADFSAAEGDEAAEYFLRLTYAQELEEHIAGFHLVDYLLIPGSNRCIGWLQFSGVAKTPLDWAYEVRDGERVYCRSVDLSRDSSGGEWSVGAGIDMRPAMPQEPLDPAARERGCVGAALADLTGATLFVRATGEWYSISDPAALDKLGQTLRFNPIPGGRAQCTVWDPIFLEHADGSTTLAYTLDSGENLLYIYGSTQSGMLGVSIFDLFGVPRASRGYSERDGVVTTHIDATAGAAALAVEYDYVKDGACIARRITDELGETRERHFEYDAAGRLSRDTMHEPDGSVSRTCAYTYDASGLLAARRDDWAGGWTREEFFYDAQGRLSRVDSYSNERASAPVCTRYSYSPDGALISEVDVPE